MSSKVDNAIKNSKPKGGANNKKPANAAAAAQLPDECDWRTITPDDVTVSLRGTGTDIHPEIIRRSKDAKGQYVHSSKDKSGKVLMTTTASMRLSTLSLLAGAGNVGTGKEYKMHHGNCYFSVGLGVGNLSDGIDRPGLVETQRAYLERTSAIARKVLGDLFDLAPPTWALPIERAKTEARKELFAKFFNDDGTVLENDTDLQALEDSGNKQAQRAVNERARVLFINRARRLPGAIIVENGIPRDPMAWVRRKVWPFANYDGTTDKGSREQGPTLQKYPIDMAHWPGLYNEITDPKGKMRRQYQPLEYVDNSTGKPLPRPTIDLKFEVRDAETAKLRTETRTVPDPFWDPCLKAPNGKLKESLVCTKLVWSLFRGPVTGGDTYGIHLRIAAPITIVARGPRKGHVVLVNEDYATGMDADDDEEEVVEEQEVEDEVKKDDADEPVADDDDGKEKAAAEKKADEDGFGEGNAQEQPAPPQRSAEEIAREDDDGFNDVQPQPKKQQPIKKRKADEEEQQDENEQQPPPEKKEVKRARQQAPPPPADDEEEQEDEQPKVIVKKKAITKPAAAATEAAPKKKKAVMPIIHNDMPDDVTMDD